MFRMHEFPGPENSHNPPNAAIGTQPFARRKLAQIRDPERLFAYEAEWRIGGSVWAYLELVAALDDSNTSIRELAEKLLHRRSPRPQHALGNASIQTEAFAAIDIAEARRQ